MGGEGATSSPIIWNNTQQSIWPEGMNRNLKKRKQTACSNDSEIEILTFWIFHDQAMQI
jgi:hypothetical protein